jgi:hypothetical protein
MIKCKNVKPVQVDSIRVALTGIGYLLTHIPVATVGRLLRNIRYGISW